MGTWTRGDIMAWVWGTFGSLLSSLLCLAYSGGRTFSFCKGCRDSWPDETRDLKKLEAGVECCTLKKMT